MTVGVFVAAAACVVAGCEQKPPPPPAPAAPGALVAPDATFTPIGGGEWQVTPTGRAPLQVRLQAGEYRTLDATGETLARLAPGGQPDTWTLFDADDARLATVSAADLGALSPGGIAADTSKPLAERALLVALSAKSR